MILIRKLEHKELIKKQDKLYRRGINYDAGTGTYSTCIDSVDNNDTKEKEEENAVNKAES